MTQEVREALEKAVYDAVGAKMLALGFNPTEDQTLAIAHTALAALPVSAVPVGEGDGTGSLRSQADLQPKEEPTGDAAHTPGPWTATQEYANRWRIEDANGLSVALAVGTIREMGAPSTPTEANARLIAAAPDLLAALKRLHKAFNAKKPIPKHEGDALEAMCCEAIAKACTPVSQGPLRAERATPPTFVCIVDGGAPCPNVCMRQGYCAWLPPTPDRDGEREG